MKHLSLLLALSLLMLGLGACGQSGPLYLPPAPNKTPAQLNAGARITPAQTPVQQPQPGPNLNQQSNDASQLFSGSEGQEDDDQGDSSN